MVFVGTTVLFKQTLIPNITNFRYFNHGSGIEHPGDIRRFKPASGNEDLNARVTRFIKPNNYCKIMCRSTAFIKNSLVPVRFHPDSSMHHPACTDFSRTRLHSLPLTKSPEHPGMCVSPWSPFLGCFRWYADLRNSGKDSVKDAAERLWSRDVNSVMLVPLIK